MARYFDYLDTATQNLPGEIYKAERKSLGLFTPDPQTVFNYNVKRKMLFNPENYFGAPAAAPSTDLFQNFLNLQQNPEALVSAQMRMPTTPFGPLSPGMV